MIGSSKIARKLGRGSAPDFAKSVLVKALGAAVLLVSSSILARSLAPAGFGLYTYIFSITSLFLTPVSAAIGNVILREIGRLHSPASGTQEVNQYISKALGSMMLLLVLPLFWIVWSVRDLDALCDGLSTVLIIVACFVLVFSMAMNSVVASVFQLNKEIALSNAINTAIRPLVFLIIVSVAVLAEAMSVQVAIAGLAASSLISLFIGRSIALRRYPGIKIGLARASGYWVFIGATVPFLFLGLVQSAYGQVTIIALRQLGTVEQVGILGVALLITSPVSVLAGLATTYVTTGIARSPDASSSALAAKSAPVSFALGLAGFAYLCFFAMVGRWLITNIYGVGYASSFNVTLVLLGAQVLSLFLGFAGPMLNMRGLERHSLACSMAALTVLVLGCLFLIPTRGVMGAAFSSATAIIFWKTTLAIVARIKLGTWILASPRIS